MGVGISDHRLQKAAKLWGEAVFQKDTCSPTAAAQAHMPEMFTWNGAFPTSEGWARGRLHPEWGQGAPGPRAAAQRPLLSLPRFLFT